MPGTGSRYEHRYPRQGSVALLCEGDIAGFEVDLLEKWTIERTGILVDVWPCGTKTSFFGVSDSIGRSRPIAVLEDRDFRTEGEADKSCKELAQDRGNRAVQIKFWRTWRRNEIENYLIEPEILIPVFAKQFDLSDATVEDRLRQVVSSFGVDQAAQQAIHRFRYLLSGKHPNNYIVGLPRKTHRPSLNGSNSNIAVPDYDAIRDALRGEFEKKKIQMMTDQQGLDKGINDILDQFGKAAADWRNESLPGHAWRQDWAGKDLLMLLLRWLAAEKGWPDSTKSRAPIDWNSFNREVAETKEREILAEVQPHLVAALLDYLEKNPSSAIGQEWYELADAAEIGF